jgi:acyl dehydratase
MPIDIDRVVDQPLATTHASWSPDDVILYHLGLGAGVPATDPRELAYTYERGLKVLPSYAVLPASDSLLAMLQMDGMDADLSKLLHGEQELEIHAPIPVNGEVSTEARVTGVYDKGAAALVVLESVSSASDGARLFTNRFRLFFRGEGGFGGQLAPRAPDIEPDGEPDATALLPTLPQQALLYRLCGDKNPLHADPAYAARGGFDRPILHGLCTYGMVLKAIVDTMAGGDVTRVARYRARFAGVLLPGETLALSMWSVDGAVQALANCAERDQPVLSQIHVDLHPEPRP